MNELVLIGKIVSTHGIKGELKVVSDFEYQDNAYKVGNVILINNIDHKITSIRYHKNYILLGIDNLDNINLVLEYIGYNIYIKRVLLNLGDDEYLYSDLIGASVMGNGKTLGKIIEIVKGNANDFVRVKGEKEFLIPLIENYIEKFDNNEKILYTINAEELIF